MEPYFMGAGTIRRTCTRSNERSSSAHLLGYPSTFSKDTSLIFGDLFLSYCSKFHIPAHSAWPKNKCESFFKAEPMQDAKMLAHTCVARLCIPAPVHGKIPEPWPARRHDWPTRRARISGVCP